MILYYILLAVTLNAVYDFTLHKDPAFVHAKDTLSQHEEFSFFPDSTIVFRYGFLADFNGLEKFKTDSSFGYYTEIDSSFGFYRDEKIWIKNDLPNLSFKSCVIISWYYYSKGNLYLDERPSMTVELECNLNKNEDPFPNLLLLQMNGKIVYCWRFTKNESPIIIGIRIPIEIYNDMKKKYKK